MRVVAEEWVRAFYPLGQPLDRPKADSRAVTTGHPLGELTGLRNYYRPSKSQGPRQQECWYFIYTRDAKSNIVRAMLLITGTNGAEISKLTALSSFSRGTATLSR